MNLKNYVKGKKLDAKDYMEYDSFWMQFPDNFIETEYGSAAA